MSLLALPPELTCQIISETIPSGFESLMLSRRTVFEAGKTLLGKYNAFRRAYKHVTFGRDSRGIYTLLLRIAQDPVIASYVESLDLWNGGQTEPSAEDNNSNGVEEYRVADDLEWLVSRSIYMCGPNADSNEWVRRLMEEYSTKSFPRYGCFILLQLLPNLRRLTPTPEWNFLEDDRDDGKFSEESCWLSLVASANDPEQVTGPLRRLEEIRPCYQTGYDSYMGLQMFEPFMAIPSTRTCSLTSCKAGDDGYTGQPFEWTYPSVSSNIVRLELACCCMTGPGIGEVVRCMPNLRTLLYSHEVKWHGCLSEWDIGEFVAHVGKWCGGFLENLSISMAGSVDGDIAGAAPYLKQFEALQTLELDLRCLEVHNPFLADLETLPVPAVSPTVSFEKDGEMYSLADILPSHIQDVRLISEVPQYHKFARQMLQDLHLRLSEDLPCLQRVELRRGTFRDRSSEEDDDAAWAKLSPWAGYTYSRAYEVEAAWHADFFRRFPNVEEV